MKATVAQPSGFRPFTLNLKVETVEEMLALWTLFGLLSPANLQDAYRASPPSGQELSRRPEVPTATFSEVCTAGYKALKPGVDALFGPEL
jgi:hypothetical protein